MSTATVLPADVREDLAKYHVLSAYDRERYLRYGDMAAYRRQREINRLGDSLITRGVPVDRTGNLPESTPDELVAAFERVLRPRYRRWHASVQPFVASNGATFERWTKHARATEHAWKATATALGVTL